MAKQKLTQTLSQKLSPQQIQFLGLLQTPITSLERRIEEELEENPALEEEEEEEGPHENIEQEGSNQAHEYFTSKQPFDVLQIEDSNESLQDFLMKQLVDLSIEDDLLFLVKYLINSLDESGFLSRDPHSISSDLLATSNLDFSDKKINDAITILKELEPVGVGAKNLQECLILQLKKLYPYNKVALKITTDHYTSFSNKNFEKICSKLNLSNSELKKYYRLIESLSPIPSAGFSKNNALPKYIYPDFTITENNNELLFSINKGSAKKIHVSKYYSDLLNETSDLKTKRFLEKKIEKALWFKEAIKKRESTLKAVMLAIIKLQKTYLISGLDSDLIPMKLADVAEIVNMDLSTVSRVSNSKFVETHFGTFKVKEFFSDAYRKDNGKMISTNEIKSRLKEVIQNENKLSPFTDEQLTEELGRDEYHIARRTVAKYRDQLGIPTAKLRREI